MRGYYRLAKALRVDSLPRAVLIDPSGRVRCHGHPFPAALISSLQNPGLGATAD